jgi:hypothetical protein
VLASLSAEARLASKILEEETNMSEPTIEQMREELIAAGWTPKTSVIWRSPTSKLWLGPAGAWRAMKDSENIDSKDADTPEELARWVWTRFAGFPVAGPEAEKEFEFLLERVRRFERSAFTQGLREASIQFQEPKKVLERKNDLA